jgi:hypothetical protein
MITESDEAAYRRWLYGTMTLVEAFALYREELISSIDSSS